jgi:hypothetical protein
MFSARDECDAELVFDRVRPKRQRPAPERWARKLEPMNASDVHERILHDGSKPDDSALAIICASWPAVLVPRGL